MQGLSSEKSLIMVCDFEQTPEGHQHLRPQPDGNFSLVLVPKREFFKAELVQERERGDGGKARVVMRESWSIRHQKPAGEWEGRGGNSMNGVLRPFLSVKTVHVPQNHQGWKRPSG